MDLSISMAREIFVNIVPMYLYLGYDTYMNKIPIFLVITVPTTEKAPIDTGIESKTTVSRKP